MKTKLSVLIENAAKAAEELKIGADVALAESAYDLTYEQAGALMEVVYEAELNCARTEGRIMEMRAATITKERQMKLAQLVEKPAK